MDKLIMNEKERKQLVVFDRLKSGEILQKQAALMLNISSRWVRKKYKRYLEDGDIGLIHKNRGKVSPHRMNKEDVALFIRLIQNEWKGFGPTFAARKFWEIHERRMSPETARKLMIEIGEWTRKKRKTRHRKRRPRKEVIGLMLQLDGSPHDWFEGRAQSCTLLVFIDDATSQILWVEFVKSESFIAVAGATKNYIKRYGIPASFYVDYGSVFSVNTNNPDREKVTQWERAVEELGSKVIHARSPQAKGRVERANRTLQDHLVKEMRLAGISSIDEGNRYIEEGDYLQKHNQMFSEAPEENGNAHLPLQGRNLNDILCQKHTRVVMNDFTVSYKSTIYQLERHQPAIVRPKNCVIIYEHLDASISIYIRRTKLNHTETGPRKKRKLSAIDYVNLDRTEEDKTYSESWVKPAGGIENNQTLMVPTASKSGTNYIGEKRN